ncbi:hypothetical protein SAMN05443253_12318 [Bacillus sp. OK048]|nr:hypothetical protein SAMN05443253_12318 [Bacillus sp. OK048]
MLSPSVQNSYNWFDLRIVNIKQFDRKNQKGYLLIRFFDKFLLADLRLFLRSMVSKENYVKTKVSGVHWKFILIDNECTVPRELMDKIMKRIEKRLPFDCRGIKITHQLIKVTLECLNGVRSKTLPQN